jgi:hypothetical protein
MIPFNHPASFDLLSANEIITFYFLHPVYTLYIVGQMVSWKILLSRSSYMANPTYEDANKDAAPTKTLNQKEHRRAQVRKAQK